MSGERIRGTVSRTEALFSESRRVLGVIERIEDEYLRGGRPYSIDHARFPFRGARANFPLILELIPHLESLIILSGKSIKFGNTGRLPFLRGRQLEIAPRDMRDVGLRLTGYDDQIGYPMPFITDLQGLKNARRMQQGAVRAFGALTPLDLLGKVRDFANRYAKKESQRIPVPNSSGGKLPWV